MRHYGPAFRSCASGKRNGFSFVSALGKGSIAPSQSRPSFRSSLEASSARCHITLRGRASQSGTTPAGRRDSSEKSRFLFFQRGTASATTAQFLYCADRRHPSLGWNKAGLSQALSVAPAPTHRPSLWLNAQRGVAPRHIPGASVHACTASRGRTATAVHPANAVEPARGLGSASRARQRIEHVAYHGAHVFFL